MRIKNIFHVATMVVNFVAVFPSIAFSQFPYEGGFSPYPGYPPVGGFDAYPGYPPMGGYPPADPRFSPYVYRAPRSVLIDSQVVPAPPLPPARIVLTHRRNETLRVEVYDRTKRQNIFQGDIPAGQSLELALPRDAGGVVHERYQSAGPYGDVVQRNVTRNIPVDVRYEIVVHQWQIQSIAIDRTGKSPSPIEDINYQGKGVGRFTLPAGALLTDGQIDVYRNAVAAGNQGLVAPVQPQTDNDGPASDPLRQIIQDLQRQR